jgi:hypothetical protein
MTAVKIEGLAGNQQGNPKILGPPVGISPDHCYHGNSELTIYDDPAK